MFYTIVQWLFFALIVWVIVGMINPKWAIRPWMYKDHWQKPAPTRAHVLHGTIIGIAAVFCILGVGQIASILSIRSEIAKREEALSEKVQVPASTNKQLLMVQLNKLIDKEAAASKFPECQAHVINDISTLRSINSDILILPNDSADKVSSDVLDTRIRALSAALDVDGCNEE